MSFKNIVKYRNVWMGIAILWIVLFHSGVNINNELLAFIKKIGYGGVDIFLLASGIGCYYSLEKDDDIFNFMRRRVLRIIPTYWIFMFGWALYHRLNGGISLRAILGNFLCIRNFTHLGGDFNWYMSAMWLMYLLAPLFKSMVDKITSILKVVFVIGFFVLFSACFWNSEIYIITITRIPIFFVGMYIGKLAWNNVHVTKKDVIISLIAVPIGFGMLLRWMGLHTDDLWQKGYYWYPFILITPGLCMVISIIIMLLKGRIKDVIEKLLGVIGDFSFEIYLLHIWFFEILEYNLIANGVVQDNRMVWMVAMLAVVPSAIILRQIKNIVMKCLEIFEKRTKVIS